MSRRIPAPTEKLDPGERLLRGEDRSLEGIAELLELVGPRPELFPLALEILRDPTEVLESSLEDRALRLRSELGVDHVVEEQRLQRRMVEVIEAGPVKLPETPVETTRGLRRIGEQVHGESPVESFRVYIGRAPGGLRPEGEAVYRVSQKVSMAPVPPLRHQEPLGAVEFGRLGISPDVGEGVLDPGKESVPSRGARRRHKGNAVLAQRLHPPEVEIGR